MLRDRITAEELKEAIRANPEHLNMDDFVQETSCGTAYCIAGWALILAGYEVEPRPGHRPQFKIVHGDIESRIAINLLNLKCTDLFFEQRWPQEILDMPGSTPAQRVEQACAAIDYFMRTEPNEPSK